MKTIETNHHNHQPNIASSFQNLLAHSQINVSTLAVCIYQDA
jgi:hypothetical protein